MQAPKDVLMPTSNEEHQQELLKKLKGKPKEIIQILMDGATHRKQNIMQAINYLNPNTFAPLLSRELKKPGYITNVGKDSMKLSKECYPMGMKVIEF